MKEAAEKALPSLSDLEKELAKIEEDAARYRKLEEELAKKEKVIRSTNRRLTSLFNIFFLNHSLKSGTWTQFLIPASRKP